MNIAGTVGVDPTHLQPMQQPYRSIMPHTTPTPESATLCCTPLIRVAVEEDLPAIATLEARIYSIEEPWSLDTFQEDFSEDGRRYLVTTCNDRIIGYAAASFDPGSVTAEILMVTVEADHRRRGVAKRLVEELLEWSAGTGAKSVNLQVRTENYGPIALYQDLGFVQTQVLKEYYQPGCDAFAMSLSLERAPATA